MEPTRGKIDPLKHRCDSCQQRTETVWECVFRFPESYAYWKSLWEERTGKRLTNRRKRRLLEREEDQIDLKAESSVAYYMDLCSACWERASSPWRAGFPEEFYVARLVNSPGHPFIEGVPNAALAKKFVPGKVIPSASGPAEGSCSLPPRKRALTGVEAS